MFTSEYSILDCSQIMPPLVIERPTNWKFNKTEIAPNCPRCASSNTKFCYYNNYSFSQPRYFCKSCKRYWTKGGSLRNVPVGGGCRKRRGSRARHMAGASYPVPAQCPDAGSTNTSESGTEIDLAAVFAKYVNPNSDTSSPGASSESMENVPESSSDIDSQTGNLGMLFEYQNKVDWINGVDDQVFPQISMDHVSDQDFVYQDSDAFEMQAILGDDPGGDALGSDMTSLTDFGSQLQLQQEFGLFSPEDQLRTSGNPITDTNFFEGLEF